jgi:hypothetical protein
MSYLRSVCVAFAVMLSFALTTGAQATGYRHHHHRHHVKVVHVVHTMAVHKVHKSKHHHVRYAKAHHRHHFVHHRPAAPKPPALVFVKAGHPGKCGTNHYYSSKIRGCADARAKA